MKCVPHAMGSAMMEVCPVRAGRLPEWPTHEEDTFPCTERGMEGVLGRNSLSKSVEVGRYRRNVRHGQ